MSAPRYFLRYGSFMTELLERPIVIGRASGCDLVTEDELASREHCRVERRGDEVRIVDLGSRNGVIVNGTRIEGSQELRHGDVITIGTQQISLLLQHRAPRLTPTMPGERLGLGDDEGDDAPTRQGDLYEMLHGAAMIALGAGDLLAAEGSARNLFVTVRGALARGGRLPSDAVPKAIALAIELADRTGEQRWLEQGLDLAVSTRALLPLERAARVAEVAARIGAPTRALGDYLKMAREIRPDDPSVRALRHL